VAAYGYSNEAVIIHPEEATALDKLIYCNNTLASDGDNRNLLPASDNKLATGWFVIRENGGHANDMSASLTLLRYNNGKLEDANCHTINLSRLAVYDANTNEVLEYTTYEAAIDNGVYMEAIDFSNILLHQVSV
jgi:hypothetical protein